MKRPFSRPARVSWTVLGVSAALAVAAAALGVSGDSDLVIVFSISALGLVFGVMGTLVVSRVPGNRVGWIFCAFALLCGFSVLGDTYIAYGGAASGTLPGRVWVGWTYQWSTNTLAPTLIILCFLLFPTGRLPSARWRSLVWVVVAAAAVHAASAALAPGALPDYGMRNPAGIESAPAPRAIADSSIQILVAPLMLLSAASLFVRLRRSHGIERQQLKWFAYAAALLAAELVAVNALDAFLGESLEQRVPELAGFLIFVAVMSGIPIAMGVAILRYRLYDIDRLINRTLVYGAVTAALILTYIGSVTLLQSVFRTLTESESQIAVVASTLAIAALFVPLRRRIQSVIDRRFYRHKYDAAKILEEFSARLRDEVELESIAGGLTEVIERALQPEHVSLWLPEPERRGADNTEEFTSFRGKAVP